MIKFVALACVASAFAMGCASAPPPPAAPVPEEPRPHQADVPPEPPKEEPIAAKPEASPRESGAKAVITPAEGWMEQTVEKGMRWDSQYMNPEYPAVVMIDATGNDVPALVTVHRVHALLCDRRKCEAVTASPDGNGGSFTFTHEGLEAKIAIRDLGGPGVNQVEMFGQWEPPAHDPAISDFEEMWLTLRLK